MKFDHSHPTDQDTPSVEEKHVRRDQFKLLSRMLFIGGVIFSCVGVFAVLSPDTVGGFLNMSNESVEILGYALCFAGLTDFMLGKIFQNKS